MQFFKSFYVLIFYFTILFHWIFSWILLRCFCLCWKGLHVSVEKSVAKGFLLVHFCSVCSLSNNIRRAMARRGTGSGTSCTELGTFAPRVAGLPLLCCRSTAALPTPKAKWQRTNPIRSTINIKDKDPSFKIRRVITFLALFDPMISARPTRGRQWAIANRRPDPPPA